MKLVSMKCPNCGGTIPEHEKGERIQCPFCDTPILIDDETQYVKFDNSENMGYEFEKGRIRAQQEAELERIKIEREAAEKRRKRDEEFARERAKQIKIQEEQERKRKKIVTILWIIGFIFFFPVALTILIIKSKRIKKVWKAVLIIFLWAFFCTVISDLRADSPQPDTQANTATIVCTIDQNENAHHLVGEISTQTTQRTAA